MNTGEFRAVEVPQHAQLSERTTVSWPLVVTAIGLAFAAGMTYLRVEFLSRRIDELELDRRANTAVLSKLDYIRSTLEDVKEQGQRSPSRKTSGRRED